MYNAQVYIMVSQNKNIGYLVPAQWKSLNLRVQKFFGSIPHGARNSFPYCFFYWTDFIFLFFFLFSFFFGFLPFFFFSFLVFYLFFIFQTSYANPQTYKNTYNLFLYI